MDQNDDLRTKTIFWSKRNRRIISAVMCSLLSLTLYLSAIPNSLESNGSIASNDESSNESSPQVKEFEKNHAPSAKKKSLLKPIIFGVVIAGAISVVLFLVVLKKKKNDITGIWEITQFVEGRPPNSWRANFIEDKYGIFGNHKEGKYSPLPGSSGVTNGYYRIDGNKIWFGWMSHATGENYNGQFVSSQEMGGIYNFWSLWVPGFSGTWVAHRPVPKK